jgi:hypothetical protein
LYSVDSENEANLWNLFEIMGECLEMMLRKCTSDAKERQNLETKVSMSSEKVEEICELLKVSGKDTLTVATQLTDIHNLIGSLKVVVNELYK